MNKTLVDQISFRGKSVIVTGAASGIGLATAKRFAEAGADLFLLDINEEALSSAKQVLPSDCQSEICRLDLSKKEEVDAFWQRFTGKVPEILINNAGIYPFMNYMMVREQDLERVLKINQNSMFWMCQNFIQKRGHDGVIVNISSIEALLPFKEDLIPYSMSKAGVIALTRSIARDYGRKGFRANVILPGAIRTPGTANLAKDAINKLKLPLLKTGYDFQQRLALGRWGEPDEVAKVILFLASDLASYIQGAMVPVDGGFLSS